MSLPLDQLLPCHYEEAVAAIRSRRPWAPGVGLVLGSGLRDLAAEIGSPTVIPYQEIPHFPQTTVEGHDGQLVLGTLEGQSVLVMQGRAHFYEGFSMQHITLPVRVMRLLGIETLILTNAAGGINPDYRTGDLMLIGDHINLPGMAGNHPLRGPNDPTFGPRFPDMSQPYDARLRRLARQAAERQGILLHEGIYAMLAGPSYETPAEIRYLRAIGVDAVGMSTVPEVIVARHCGLRVLAVSGISNMAIADPQPGQVVNHEEVLMAGKAIGPKLMRLIRDVMQGLP